MQIVQFNHPGREFDVVGMGNASAIGNNRFEVPWRRTNDRHTGHARRLAQSEGTYIDCSGNICNAPLAFWTEWEAETTALRIGSNRNFGMANYVHFPKYPKAVDGAPIRCNEMGARNGDDAGYMNTDPCVFGDTFKYAVCHQRLNGRMRRLSPRSLIVFGSYHNAEFYLDTVFVTSEERIDYTLETVDSINCSDAYKNLTLRRVNGQYTFYRGVKYAPGAETRSRRQNLLSMVHFNWPTAY